MYDSIEPGAPHRINSAGPCGGSQLRTALRDSPKLWVALGNLDDQDHITLAGI